MKSCMSFRFVQKWMNLNKLERSNRAYAVTSNQKVIKVKGEAEHLYSALHGIQTTLKR